MRRAPAPSVDLGVYARALPLLARTPTLVVVPFLALVVGVLLRVLLAPGANGAIGSLTYGLAQFAAALIALWGLGSACILADEAWRRPRASFESAWAETRRKGADLFSAAIGVALLVSVGQYVSTIVGGLGIIVEALAVYFLIWAIPAAAIGGVPGGAAINVSIERVRQAPLAAGVATAVAIALYLVATFGAFALLPYLGVVGESRVGSELVVALLQAIATAYIATVIVKTYADAAYGRRPW